MITIINLVALNYDEIMDELGLFIGLTMLDWEQC